MQPGSGECEHVDDLAMTLWDMEAYGVDMVLLYPSMIGTTNEGQLALQDKHPDKFRSWCADQETKLKCHRENIPWTIDAAAEEIEKCLKTGLFIGIGEFIPRHWEPEYIYTIEQRFEEYCIFGDLARKYKVPFSYHELQWADFPFDPWVLLNFVASKYWDVPIVVNHGGQSIGDYTMGDWKIRKSLNVAGKTMPRLEKDNLFLEVGTWQAEWMRMACDDPNVGPTQLLWGSDYGNVPQYITTDPRREANGVATTFSTSMKRWRATPDYQSDWWGWETTQIEKLKQWVGQDEVNLIVGGNAAKLFKLPVPCERMFLSGRPDIYGIYYESSKPFIPIEQVINIDQKAANAAVIEERKKNPPKFHPTDNVQKFRELYYGE